MIDETSVLNLLSFWVKKYVEFSQVKLLEEKVALRDLQKENKSLNE